MFEAALGPGFQRNAMPEVCNAVSHHANYRQYYELTSETSI